MSPATLGGAALAFADQASILLLAGLLVLLGFFFAVAGGAARGDQGERIRKRGLCLMVVGACGFAAVLVFGSR